MASGGHIMFECARVRSVHIVTFGTAIIVLMLCGCRHKEAAPKYEYTPEPRAMQTLNQGNTQVSNDAPPAPGAIPNPMNDAELKRKGQEILQRTGGDVNKMSEDEKKTFYEAARNGHL